MSLLEQESKRGRERERVVWRAPVALHSLYQALLFLLLISCPHGTVLLDVVGMDHMAVGNGTSTWQLGWKVGSTLRCRVVLPEVRHWKLVESYRLQTLCECRERRRGYPAVVNSGKIAVLEKTMAGMGDDEPILAGKKVLETELEKLQKKLNGPKKTAKHIEAKTKLDQQGIQTSRGGVCKADGIAREPQSAERNIESGLRGNQDSQRGPSERGRNDGQKQEPLLVSGGHGGNPEARTARTVVLERGSTSKRLAGWTRDGSTEEIAGWMMEAQRLNKEVEAKKRKLQETIERESKKDARMDDAMDGLDGSLSS